MNPKIEEIVKDLRGCALGDDLPCDTCVATGKMICGCSAELMLIAADLITELQQELIDERYRHDRLQDFCVAQGEGLSACISDMTAYVQRKIRDECDLCKRAAPREFCREVDYDCAICNHTAGCVCARCRAGDQFEWRGVPVPNPPKEEECGDG